MTHDLTNWLETIGQLNVHLFAKRLAGNDTLLTGAHQAGPYLPKDVVFAVFPAMASSQDPNPDVTTPTIVDSHGLPERPVRTVWYNRETRNECRMTGWGGGSSPILDPESTGGLCLFAFVPDDRGVTRECRVWLCRDVPEEEIVEAAYGEVVPGTWFFNPSDQSVVIPAPHLHRCWLRPEDMPPQWMRQFPTTTEIHRETLRLHGAASGQTPDQRLLTRRDCEYQLFLSVEEAHVLPRIRTGFANVEEFVKTANSITQRRKARSGLSLELHIETIFREEGLLQFERGAMSETKKTPDFLFPSARAYHDTGFPSERLRMLGVKTTCRDRWRQVADEANRIAVKHLLTLQEGVSINQFEQMRDAGIRLVVPSLIHKRYPAEIRPALLSLSQFIDETKQRIGT